MKDVKDFDENQFVPDGLSNKATAATGDTQSSKRSIVAATSKPSVQTVQDEKARQTASTAVNWQSALSQQVEQFHQAIPAQSTEQAQATQSTMPTPQRTSSRHRRASLDEYRVMFLLVPRITDRQPVFVSRVVRDKIDSVVRRLGDRKMSVSGFLENLVRHHLDLYADDLEQWKRL